MEFREETNSAKIDINNQSKLQKEAMKDLQKAIERIEKAERQRNNFHKLETDGYFWDF